MTNGSGTIAGANVTDVEIECATPGATGDLDPLFDADGIVTTNAVTGAKSLAIQTDGKLVMVSNPAAWLTRYNADGSPDTGFGANGIVRVKFKANGETARGVALHTDGRIVVVGLTYSATSNDFGVARYDVNGSLDPSFGDGGTVSIDVNGEDDDAWVPLIQPDGKILVAGNGGTSTPVGLDSDFTVVRLTSTGALDDTFGNAGKAHVNIGGRADQVSSAVLQSDGKDLVAGRVGVDGGSLPDSCVVRYTDLGVPDASFGSNANGIVRLDLAGGGEFDEAIELALQPDGKIVLAALVRKAGVYQHALVRLTSGGRVDAGFGINGLAMQSFAAGGDYARAVAIQSDGRIVAAGFTRPILNSSAEDDFLITRHDPDGWLDPSFADEGKLDMDFFTSSDGAECIAIQPDGKIIAAGLARNGSTNGLAIVRVVP